MMTEDSRIESLAGLTCRVWDPSSKHASRIAILLHGRGGDENSMAVFRTALPADATAIMPRGPFSDPNGGYAWHALLPNDEWPQEADFAESVLRVAALTAVLRSDSSGHDAFFVAGFSQGAAAATSFALRHRDTVAALALLAGFVADAPGARHDELPLRGLPVFLAYGTDDELVPALRSRHAIESLASTGAALTTCDAPIGHKVSASCLRALREWLVREWVVAGVAGGVGEREGFG
jgi:phospholipase/carboxylesterase